MKRIYRFDHLKWLIQWREITSYLTPMIPHPRKLRIEYMLNLPYEFVGIIPGTLHYGQHPF